YAYHNPGSRGAARLLRRHLEASSLGPQRPRRPRATRAESPLAAPQRLRRDRHGAPPREPVREHGQRSRPGRARHRAGAGRRPHDPTRSLRRLNMPERVLVCIGTKKGLFVAEAPTTRDRFALRGPFGPGVAVYASLIDTRDTPRVYASSCNAFFGMKVLCST